MTGVFYLDYGVWRVRLIERQNILRFSQGARKIFQVMLRFELWRLEINGDTRLYKFHIFRSKYLIGRKFVGGKIRRPKRFVSKKFRHLPKISLLFADEFSAYKVHYTSLTQIDD